ncbi:E3 UFM1-protein ligase 1 homolog [Nymphaea colorata]|nr:E3 UFM1-protein ligase 1 homolog [Nymphaea colorata]
MDQELVELQRQFEAAQQAKSSIRLSERNVVELVTKLQELRIIDFDLIHTSSGKEYITLDQLKLEIESEIKKLRRVSLIELADTIGVDLYHVERQAREIVANSQELMLIQGEIMSESYWDSISEEVNERLQECSQIALAELAAQLHVSSELISNVVEPRLGRIVKGRLEGGQLYTPSYIARVNAMVRGAVRGITVPTNLSTVWNSLQQLLQETDGAVGISVEASLFQSLFNEILKEKEVLGSLRAGMHWTPAVFALAQRESIESFFSQNSYINYDVLHKLAVAQPKQYLQSRYPEGIPLETVFVHPSMVEMLDAAVEDAIEHASWIDSLSVLPSFFGHQDAAKLLSHCPLVQSSFRNAKAVLLGEIYILSTAFIKSVFSQMELKVDDCIQAKLSSSHGTHDSSCSSSMSNSKDDSGINGDESSGGKHLEKGSKKKKNKSTVSTKSGGSENNHETLSNLPTKNKKHQGKGRDSNTSQVSDTKPSTKKESSKFRDDELDSLSEEWMCQQILELFPDFEGHDGPDSLVMALVMHLRPMLLSSWKERRNAVLMATADRRRRMIENMQRKLDESSLEMQLFGKALDLFEDDPSISLVLHRHLLRTMGASIVDWFLINLDIYNKLNTGGAVEEIQISEPPSLGSAERQSIIKSLPRSLSMKALLVVEALEGKQVDTFMNALWEMAEESGLSVKKLDKKLERTMLHSYRKDLLTQVSAETDPVALLPKVISLLYLQVYNKVLQAPGRAISAAVSKLKDKLDVSAYTTISEYHAATVTLLSLLSAATDDEMDCTADRILSKREFLESRMPALKALVSGNSSSTS